MTAIAAVVQDGKIWMGGDSASASGGNVQTISTSKVWTTSSGMVIGSAGDVRAGNIFQHGFQEPPVPEGLDPLAYLCTVFVDALRTCLKGRGALKTEAGYESAGLHALIGFRGRLFTLWTDFSVTEARESYLATGSGGELALAVIHATPTLPPKDRILLALETAAHFNAWVRPPFNILCGVVSLEE